MDSKSFDAIIVGCGLAGATLAWRLHLLGWRLLVFDHRQLNSASHAAAGIMSPCSGKRHTPTWGWSTFWPEALRFYKQIEDVTGLSLIREIPQLRLLNEPLDKVVSRSDPALTKPIVPERLMAYPGLSQKITKFGAISVPSGLLNVGTFLQASYEMLNQHHELRIDFLPLEEIRSDANGVWINATKHNADQLIFCEGAGGSLNPFFKDIVFQAVRGEALIIESEGLPDSRIYHHHISLVPFGAKLFYAGASYDRDNLHTNATAAGKNSLRDAIKNMLCEDFHIIEHRAGLRPVIRGRRPLICQHPSNNRIWFFNGLASRGCLQAPHYSKLLCAALRGNKPLTHLTRHHSNSPTNDTLTHKHNARLTTVAHQLIKKVLRPGDIAIDATAGNGNDTFLLAKLTLPSGKVFSFDIQDSALTRTSERLKTIDHHHVVLLRHDHAEAASLIPKEAHGEITAIVFNLGYLPGSDQSVVTHSASTVKAIAIALELLKAGGLLSVLCYQGHPGGAKETAHVGAFFKQLSTHDYRVQKHLSVNQKNHDPVLYAVQKLP